MTVFLLDHLWQSTAVLIVIGLMTMLFRNNGAHVRHALWLAASLKFLLPFAALAALGEYVSGFAAWVQQPAAIATLEVMAQPFSGYEVLAAAGGETRWLAPLTAAWGLGFLALGAVWLQRWLKLRVALRVARDVAITAAMPVKLSPHLMEPGLVGIIRPTLLMPAGIAEKLSPAELQAIVTHEACHLRRRDNLTAMLHMLVQAIFWFWPPVWWLGTRLLLERERACDEAVVATGNDPEVYAESILKVCKFYVSSPLACASGVSGADLKKRIEEIMGTMAIARLSLPKKALLLASGAAILALPLSLGLPNVPAALAQSDPGLAPPRRVVADNLPMPATQPVRLIAQDNAPVPARPVVPPVTGPVAPEPAPVLEVAQLPASPQPPQGPPCRAEPVAYTHTKPPQPEESIKAGESGTVEVWATVVAAGHASDVVVMKSSGFARLDELAARHVRENWIWKPLTCGAVRAPIRIVFTTP
jgi:TonB family protein